MNLRFYTLGRFELYRDGYPVPRTEWGTHRAATLCKVLLTHPHQRLHKEQLQDWIWPEATPDAAARNLRVALSELRRILEPQRKPRDPSCFIPAGGETLTLEAGDIWVDSRILRQAVETARGDSMRIETLRSALSLYQGPYLPDDLYAEWSQVERGSLALAYETGLLALIEGYAARRDYANALRISRRALASHPTSEAFAERLMRYALELGETAVALRAFQELNAALRHDLDMGPSPRLAKLAQAIRAEADATRAGRPASLAPPAYSRQLGQLGATLNRSADLLAEIQAALARMRESRAHFNLQADEARGAARMDGGAPAAD